MTDLADVVGAPFVIGRDGLLARHPMAGATVLATGHRVGDGGGPGYQRVCRLGPANWGVTQGTIVLAKVVGALVAIAAHVVQPLEVRPGVAVEAAHRGVLPGELHWMHPQPCLFPGLGGCVTIFTGEGQGHVVRTDVTGVAISEQEPQIAILVAVQAYIHRTDDFACHWVETVAHLSMAIAALHPTL